MEEERPKQIKAVNGRKKKQSEESQFKQASIDSQARLAEILSDSPHIVSLNGTEWEVRALRMGTQWLIADNVCKLSKKEHETMGDIMANFSNNIPAVVNTITLALLNDRNKIFEGGVESNGFSSLYRSTYDTLMWECPVEQFAGILLEVLQMLDVNFTMDAVDTMKVLTASVTAKKRMRMKERK